MMGCLIWLGKREKVSLEARECSASFALSSIESTYRHGDFFYVGVRKMVMVRPRALRRFRLDPRDLDWAAANVETDDRSNYEEDRFIGYAPLGERVYCVAFTFRGDALRIISLRKANRREVQRYEQQT